MLVQLVYISEATIDITHDELAEIVRKSVINNSEIGVTGILIKRQNQFMQVLEGEEPAINVLLRHIRADKRHTRLMTIQRQAIKKREFPDWAMGWSDLPPKTDGMAGAFDRITSNPNDVLANIESDLRLLLNGFQKGLWAVR